MSVTTEYRDNLALITVDDGKANAMNLSLLEALAEALEKTRTRAQAVVVAGRPGAFCAGFDLSVMRSEDRTAIAELVQRGGQMVRDLYAYPLPLVAAATGHGLALGGLFLLAFDTRVGASGKFRYGLNETAIGMVMPGFGREIARARMNPRHLTEAVLQARLYDAEGAREAGFLDQVVAPEAVPDTALAVAAELAQLPGDAYAGCKAALRADALTALDQSLASPAR